MLYSSTSPSMSIKFSEQKLRYMAWKWNRWFEIEKYLWEYVSSCPYLCPITIFNVSGFICWYPFLYPNPLSWTRETSQLLTQGNELLLFCYSSLCWVRKPRPFRFWELDWEIKAKTGLEVLFAVFDLLPALNQVFGENPTWVHLCLVLYKQLLFRKYSWLVSWWILGTDLRSLEPWSGSSFG